MPYIKLQERTQKTDTNLFESEMFMAEVTEIFVMRMKDPERADKIRERAREDFTTLDGVTSWKTYVTTDANRPTLFAEIYTFPDYETAKRVTPQFAEREPTKEFLNEVDEILVGQYFTKHIPGKGII